MTMHLARGLSTISTKKRKKKALKQKDIDRYTIEWRKHNKAMRRANNHSLQYDTVDDYIAYVRGEYKAPKRDRGTYTPDTSWRRDGPVIKSSMEQLYVIRSYREFFFEKLDLEHKTPSFFTYK